jgi:DNA-binding response OmpR family regulator
LTVVLGRKRDEVWGGKERRSPATVLVVNDDAAACQLLTRMIEQGGYRAIGVTSDSEATAKVMTDLPRCIVLDLAGGGIGSSLQVLDHIRSHTDERISNARVVLCASSPKNRSFSFQSGADSFLVRPFHIDELLAQVTDVLRRPHEERARQRRDELTRHQ